MYAQAFEKSACAGLNTLHLEVRKTVFRQQVDVLELGIQLVMSQQDSVQIDTAIEQMGTFFHSISPYGGGYSTNTIEAFEVLNSVTRLDDQFASSLRLLENRKRDDVYKAFVYHPTAKIGNIIMERAQSKLKAETSAREFSTTFTSAREESNGLHDELISTTTALACMGDQNVQLKPKVTVWMKLITDASEELVGQQGCSITSQDVMGFQTNVATIFMIYGAVVARACIHGSHHLLDVFLRPGEAIGDLHHRNVFIGAKLAVARAQAAIGVFTGNSIEAFMTNNAQGHIKNSLGSYVDFQNNVLALVDSACVLISFTGWTQWEDRKFLCPHMRNSASRSKRHGGL